MEIKTEERAVATADFIPLLYDSTIAQDNQPRSNIHIYIIEQKMSSSHYFLLIY